MVGWVELNSTAGEMCTERVFFFRLVILRFLNGCQAPPMADTQQRVMYFFRLLLDSTGGMSDATVRKCGRPACPAHTFPRYLWLFCRVAHLFFFTIAQRWTQKKISVSPADAICAYSWIFLRLPNKSQYVQLRKADAESHFFLSGIAICQLLVASFIFMTSKLIPFNNMYLKMQLVSTNLFSAAIKSVWTGNFGCPAMSPLK